MARRLCSPRSCAWPGFPTARCRAARAPGRESGRRFRAALAPRPCPCAPFPLSAHCPAGGHTPGAQTSGTAVPPASTRPPGLHRATSPPGPDDRSALRGEMKGQQSVMPAGVGPTFRPPAGAHPARVRWGRPQDPLTGQVKEPVVVRHVWLGFRHGVPLCQQGGWSSGLCQLEDPRAGDGHLGCLGHLGHLGPG